LRDGCAVQGWLVTALSRECLARARTRTREQPVADFVGVDEPVHVVDFDRRLEVADQRRILQSALMKFSESQRELIAMLFADPAPSYPEISRNLAVPIGSIGPTRSRLLDKLLHAISQEPWELANAS
jgi:DNA-directed RNA polymerase specialized sigma24 family protein